MSSLPEAKLDVLLAHHASLEAESLGQLSSERYVQVTRELAELTRDLHIAFGGELTERFGLE